MIKAGTGLFLFPFSKLYSLIHESCKLVGPLVIWCTLFNWISYLLLIAMKS